MYIGLGKGDNKEIPNGCLSACCYQLQQRCKSPADFSRNGHIFGLFIPTKLISRESSSIAQKYIPVLFMLKISHGNSCARLVLNQLSAAVIITFFLIGLFEHAWFSNSGSSHPILALKSLLSAIVKLFAKLLK